MKNKLYFLYLTIIGSAIIISHLYFRLFRSKEPYTLDLLREHMTPLKLVLSMGFIFAQLTTIIAILYFLYKQYFNIVKTSKFITWISQIANKVYWEPLEHIHDMIAPGLPYSGTFIMNIAEFVEKGNKDLKYKIYRHSYILFQFVPQIFVSSIFFIDIVILNHFKYFLYVVILLLIPVLFKIYLKLCESFFSRNVEIIHKILDIRPEGEPNKEGKYERCHFILRPQYVQDPAILKDYMDTFLLLQCVVLHVMAIKENSAKYAPYVILFTSTLYLTAALYRLLFILLYF